MGIELRDLKYRGTRCVAWVAVSRMEEGALGERAGEFAEARVAAKNANDYNRESHEIPGHESS